MRWISWMRVKLRNPRGGRGKIVRMISMLRAMRIFMMSHRRRREPEMKAVLVVGEVEENLILNGKPKIRSMGLAGRNGE